MKQSLTMTFLMVIYCTPCESSDIDVPCSKGDCQRDSIDDEMAMLQVKIEHHTQSGLAAKEATHDLVDRKASDAGNNSGDRDLKVKQEVNQTKAMMIQAARKQMASCDDNKAISGSSNWWSCNYDNMYVCGSSCCCATGFSYDLSLGCIACPRQGYGCAKDSDRCLSQSPGWSGYTCAQVKSYCNEWNKDLWRCCSETCDVNPPCTAADCMKLGGQGTCMYPNSAQLCDRIACPDHMVTKFGTAGLDHKDCCKAAPCEQFPCPSGMANKELPGLTGTDASTCCRIACEEVSCPSDMTNKAHDDGNRGKMWEIWLRRRGRDWAESTCCLPIPTCKNTHDEIYECWGRGCPDLGDRVFYNIGDVPCPDGWQYACDLKFCFTERVPCAKYFNDTCPSNNPLNKSASCDKGPDTCNATACCEANYEEVGMGQCTDDEGNLVDSSQKNSIGWAPCTGNTNNYQKGECSSLEICKRDCTANFDCGAIGYYDGLCWLYAKMPKSYTAGNGKYDQYQCWSNNRKT